MKNANTKSRVSSVSKLRARLLTSWAAVSVLAASLLFTGLLTGCPGTAGGGTPSVPVDPAAILKTDGNGKIIGYKCAKEELPAHLVIPAKIGDEEIKEIGAWVFDGCTGLRNVTLPASLTQIDEKAFRGCTGLTSISLPANLTEIGEFAFYDCTGLTSLDLSACTSLTTIGEYAFEGCTGLTSISLPANLTTIGEGAFAGCTGLTSLTIDSANTTYKTEGNILYNKAGTTLIFAAGGLTSANIPDTVTTIGEGAFAGCTGLTSIDLSASTSLTTIGEGAFEGCKSLTSITLPANLTKIDKYTFSDCTGLTSITLPANLTQIGEYAFYGCGGLASAVFEDKNYWKVYDDDSYSGTSTSINSSDLNTAATAAKYLREETDEGGYCDKYWKKN